MLRPWELAPPRRYGGRRGDVVGPVIPRTPYSYTEDKGAGT